VSSPADYRLRFTTGLFYQRQSDEIRYDYRYANNGDPLISKTSPVVIDPVLNPVGIYSVDGSPGDIYLAQEVRTDHDYAVFADGTFDILDNLKLSAGIRGYDSDTTLTGFFGFGEYQGALAPSGEGICTTPIVYNQNLPCNNTDKYQSASGETHRLNLTYQIDPEAMIYATYSTGFRAGGANRVPFLPGPNGAHLPTPNYKPDKLSNYEFGWKTAWFDRRVRFNGAVFYEKWDGLQIGVPGPNGITSIFNAGNADSKGIEGDLSWNATENLNISMSGTYVDAKLTTDFCRFQIVNGSTVTPLSCASDPTALLAPSGTRLPVTPQVKGNLTARYKFDVAGYNSFVQASALHRSSSSTWLIVSQDQQTGDEAGFTTYDFSAGTGAGSWSVEAFIENAFDERGQLGRNVQCVVGDCYALARIYPAKPQFFGVKFAQKF
jgi:outer membrane receptor protein involved in Fe transport